MGLLDGRVALITGAARGMGRAHAVAHAREGADVVLVDVAAPLPTVAYPGASADDLAETARLVEKHGRTALTFEADVRDQQQLDDAVAEAVARLGRIDVLVANAGIWTQAPFWELSDEAWEEMIGVNLSGVWRSAKAVTPHMIERGSGSIVLISSTNGLEPGVNFAHYTSAKHGVIGLMRNIALELAPHGVRCNAISPGATNTPMVNHPKAWARFGGRPDAGEEVMIPAGLRFHALRDHSFLPPERIADAGVFLSSDLASAVTGVVLPVDAGHLLLTGANSADMGLRVASGD